MNSRTAKALDKTLVKIEKEFERLKLLMMDIRKDIYRHYYAKPKPSDFVRPNSA